MSDDTPDEELFSKGTEIKLPTWDELDATPNDDLRELLEEWREQTENNAGNLDWKFIHNKCADELEEVLEDG